MTNRGTTKARPQSRGAEKRRVILTGALAVFARDGYARASIDSISAEASVSTRTIYNHFGDKARLFREVIQESAARVAEAQIGIMDRYLREVTDLEADLVEFARAWVTPTPDYAEHFALVRHINADAGHIPPEAIDAWQEMGPLRVLRELARRLRRFAERGLLRVDDPDLAAFHFANLVSISNPSHRAAIRSDAEIDEIVAPGVRVFLHGYLP